LIGSPVGRLFAIGEQRGSHAPPPAEAQRRDGTQRDRPGGAWFKVLRAP